MNHVNFIPLPRRELESRRSRLRAWAMGTAAYVGVTVLALCAWLPLAAAAAADDDQTVIRKLEELPEQIASSQRAIRLLEAQLSDVQANLEAKRAVALQPDWSILLALLAQSLHEDVVLTACRLDTSDTASGANTAANAAGHLVRISGMGRSQSAVSQFVLQLEQIGLFERVTILKTGRDLFADQEAVSFHVEATIGGGAARAISKAAVNSASAATDTAGGVSR